MMRRKNINRVTLIDLTSNSQDKNHKQHMGMVQIIIS